MMAIDKLADLMLSDGGQRTGIEWAALANMPRSTVNLALRKMRLASAKYRFEMDQVDGQKAYRLTAVVRTETPSRIAQFQTVLCQPWKKDFCHG